MPAKNHNFEAKPVIDAVNDAVSALSDLVRSLRTQARSTARNVKKDVKEGVKNAKRGASTAKRRVAASASGAKENVVSRLKNAWSGLTGNGSDAAPPARSGRSRAKGRRRKTA